MKHYLYILLLAAAGIAMSGCNTTKGFGKDVEAAGETIEDVAEDTEEEIEEM